MASIQDLQNDIGRYTTLKDKLNNLARELEYSAQRTGASSNLLASEFKVNNESSKVSDRQAALKSDMASTVDYLRATVIPAIDEAIAGARSEIAYLEEQERQRREAEERRQREEQEQREREEREQREREEEERRRREEQSRTRRR
jgi:hypothetical protein